MISKRQCRADRKSFGIRRRFGFVILVLLVFSFLIGSPISAQGQQQETLPSELAWQSGFHGFAELLRRKEINVLGSVDALNSIPVNQSFVVVFGEVQPSLDTVKDYLRRGGRVLIASEYDYSLYTNEFGLTVNAGGEVFATNNSDAYGNLDKVTIQHFPNRDHPLIAGVNAIVTNRPGIATIERGRVARMNRQSTLAYFPRIKVNGRTRRGVPLPFLFESPLNANGGRLLALPDESVFSNAMLSAGSNLAFTLNVIDWLSEGDRKNGLILLAGSERVPASLADVTIYRPPPDARETLDALNRLLDNTDTRDRAELLNEALEFAQEERLLEEMVDSLRVDDFMSKEIYYRTIFVTAAWVLVVVFLFFLSSARKKPFGNQSIDGLNPDPKKEQAKREFLERYRSAEALFIHFFNRLGYEAIVAGDVDPKRIALLNDPAGTRALRKEIQTCQNDLKYKPLLYWTQGKVGQIGRYIAHWANLYETGAVRVQPVDYDGNISDPGELQELPPA